MSDDTDGDGLTDWFEAEYLLSWTSPVSADSDADGIGDGQEDLDGDDLTELEEQQARTSPTEPDTDGDALSDGQEVVLGTDPLATDTDEDTLIDGQEPPVGLDPTLADTDGDGIRDDKELVDASLTTPSGVTVELTGSPGVAKNVTVTAAQGPRAQGVTGMLGHAWEIHAPQAVAEAMSSARITLPVPETDVPAQDLAVFTYDTAVGSWVPTGTDLQVSADGQHVSVSVNHFSLYAVFDIVNWGQIWSVSTCEPRDSGDGTGTYYIDLAFVLDSSGSMTTNDPDGLRKSASKTFTDALLDEDRAAVVDFNSWATLRQALTSDKAAVNAAIDLIGASGGTNIGAGVSTGLDALDADVQDGRGRMMILLTDGQGSYSTSLTTRANDGDVTIHVVGLGSSVNSSLLQSIASGTGGEYYGIDSAEDLPEVFRIIEDGTGGDPDAGKDTDEDGLNDCLERNGVPGSDGRTYVTDPTNPDSDDDGVPDGDETGDPITQIDGWGTPTGQVYPIHSDPTVEHTDGDGFNDGNELDYGTDPWLPDSDFDTLNDAEEVEWGTDPLNPNTDGDTDGDAYEAAHTDDGIDPVVYDTKISKLTYLSEATKGFIFGDMWPSDTLPWLAGAIASSSIPLVDLRDILGAAIHGDFVGAGFNAIGLLPIGGDAASAVAKAVKFVTVNPHMATATAVFIAKADNLPSPARLKAVKATLKPGTWDALKQANVRDETILKLARRKRNDLDLLANVLQRPGHVPSSALTSEIPEWNDGWKKGEEWMEKAFNATEDSVDRHRWFAIPDDSKNWRGRFLDVFKNDIARETKTGYVKYNERLRTQIEKDAHLLRGREVQGVHWHFVANSKSKSIGSDEALFDLLDKHGFKYTIHLP